MSFLLGVFEEDTRLLHWLVFLSVQRNRSFFLFICSTSRPTKFLVSEKQVNVGSIFALNQKFFMLQKYSGDQRVPPLQFFRPYATFFREVYI